MPDPSVGASGLLAKAEALGLLSWGDVHVATKLAFLFDEPDERVAFALALTVATLRAGSVCLDLSEVRGLALGADDAVVEVPDDLWPDDGAWRAALRDSPLVAVGAEAPTGRPLRLVGELLYLERYWRDESVVAEQLLARRALPPTRPDAARLREVVGQLFDAEPDQSQATAVTMALLSPVTVIAGGPGTGKTATIARVLAGLLALGTPPARVALTAPTGKAAARVEEAIAEAAARAPAEVRPALGQVRATTIHRLLGWTPDSRNRFAHNAGAPLPSDVVVIDEASMVSLPLMARLLDALRPQARLILVGDPDQLAPVEAGAVLADIVDAHLLSPAGPSPQAFPPGPSVPTTFAPPSTSPVTPTTAVPSPAPAAAPTPAPSELAGELAQLGLPPSGPVVRLRRNWRFSGTLAELAKAVLDGDEDEAVRLAAGGDPSVAFGADAGATDVRDRAVDAGLRLARAARAGDARTAVEALSVHRLLCAHRQGLYGVSWWTRQIEGWLAQADPEFSFAGQWYPGRPLLIGQNAPDLGLYNGDTGVVVEDAEAVRAYFPRGRDLVPLSVFALDQVQTAHAMTVHKAQGSQFDAVSLILPPPESPLLTRELLYTAITRARSHVTLVGGEDALRAAIRRRARRASGLAARLAPDRM